MKLSDRTPYEAQVRAIDARLKFAELRLTRFPSCKSAGRDAPGQFIDRNKSRGREFCESSAAPVGEDAALLSSFGDGSFTTSSGWTDPIFYGRIRCNRSRRFVRGSPASTSSKWRLHFRNTTLQYLKAHKCLGLTAGRARVYSIRGQYVCIYDPKDNKTSIYPCAWTRTEMLSK